MGQRDDRVDAYITGAAEFARPILIHLRELIHRACPEVEETIKWSRPHFVYKGLLCGISAFKEHCAFGFWKGAILRRRAGEETIPGMGDYGKITCLADLPADKLIIDRIHQAMMLNGDGAELPATPKPKKAPRELLIPDDLSELLAKNDQARAVFEKFSTSHRREYVEWINEARTEPTRIKRLTTTLEWLTEGKLRHWKHQNC